MHDRIDEAAKRANASKSEWATMALEMFLEIDEGTREPPEIPHVPVAVQNATPHYETDDNNQARVHLPAGRIPGVR